MIEETEDVFQQLELIGPADPFFAGGMENDPEGCGMGN